MLICGPNGFYSENETWWRLQRTFPKIIFSKMTDDNAGSYTPNITSIVVTELAIEERT